MNAVDLSTVFFYGCGILGLENISVRRGGEATVLGRTEYSIKKSLQLMYTCKRNCIHCVH